jgi:hypothetical protein
MLIAQILNFEIRVSEIFRTEGQAGVDIHNQTAAQNQQPQGARGRAFHFSFTTHDQQQFETVGYSDGNRDNQM